MDNKNINGDVSVSRNVSVGGRSTIQGDVRVGHNLKVDGWLIAQNIQGASKGAFEDEDKLKATYPNPLDGWCAGVGSDMQLYVAYGGQWNATEGKMPFEKGDNGQDGADGQDGMSAYEIAKKLDPTIGTEEEWIASLQGAKGDDGQDGQDAVIANQRMDEQGNTVITWNDGKETMISKGDKGNAGKSAFDIAREHDPSIDTEEKFLASIKGAAGNDGKSATIKKQETDADDNVTIYWSDGKTTYVKRGLQGEQGPQGHQGQPGPKGDKGDPGEPGKDGGLLLPRIYMNYRGAKLVIDGRGEEVSRFTYDARQGKLKIEI